MRTPRRSALSIFLAVAACFGCNEKPSAPVPSATPPSTAAPQATPSASVPAPAGGGPGVRYASAEASKDKWLVVSKGGVELAVLELRAMQPGVLHLQAKDAAVVADLKQRWDELRGPSGIAVKMHLPTEDGEGRGPLGARVFKPGEPDYAMAVEQELEPTFDVEPVPSAVAPDPPKAFRVLTIARSGEKVGSIDFSASPPKLRVDTAKSDGDFLKSDFELLSKAVPLRVRYVRANAGSGTLVTETASPGEPEYARVFMLSLILTRQYDAQRTYVLGVE